jgi:hypothetical protein
MIKNKSQSLRKPPPPRKTESIKHVQHKPLTPPLTPPRKIESIQKPEQNSLLNTMKDGFAFGFGSSIGHKIVNEIFSDKKETNTSNISNISNNNDKNISENKVVFTGNKEEINNVEILFKKYNECIENNKKDNDISECLKILEKNNINF